MDDYVQWTIKRSNILMAECLFLCWSRVHHVCLASYALLAMDAGITVHEVKDHGIVDTTVIATSTAAER